MTGGDRARLAAKQPRAVAYRLSVRYTGSYLFTSDVGTAKSSLEVAGITKRFWLIRSGTASKPSYTIASADKRTPEYLWLTVPIVFTGKTHFQFQHGCTYDGTVKLSHSTGHVEIVLAKNDLTADLTTDARYVRRISSGCWCDPTSESEPCPHNLNQPVWPRLPVFDWGENRGNHRTWWLKQVKFAQRFTIADFHSCLVFPNDPLCVHSPGIDESWTWHWTLTFIPA